MATTIISVTATATVTADGFTLPDALRAELNLQPGTEITVTISNKPRELPADLARLIRETRGMFAGGPSMTDELLEQRKEDELRSKW